MVGRAFLLLLMVALTGCAGVSGQRSGTGNMAGSQSVKAPAHVRWYTGQLTVEPLDAGEACLLLVTPHGSFTLRSAKDGLTPVAWEQDGEFDATHSGIARGRRLIAPYSEDRTSVRGARIADPAQECNSHPVLAFTAVARGRRVGRHVPRSTAGSPVPTVPSESPLAPVSDGGGAALQGGSSDDEAWFSGHLILVDGNQHEEQCLALDTAVGAYVLGSSTNDYDVVVTSDQGHVDPRRTGIHIHGRNSLGMARLLGQQVEILGSINPGTDFDCSRYHTLAMSALR